MGLAKTIANRQKDKSVNDVVNDIFNTRFCGDSFFRNNLITKLYGSFPSNIVDIIKWRYENMMNNLFTPHQTYPPSPFTNTRVLNNTKDVLLEVDQSLFTSVTCLNSIWQYTNLGHDLPIWLDRPLDDTYPQNPPDAFDFENKKRIMIIGQDPLRSNLGPGKMFISSVFGLHSMDWRRNLITTKIFNELLRKECCLYLTDFNKLYVESRTNSPKHVSAFNKQFRSMLYDEINLFKPDLIVTWGVQASMRLLGPSFVFFPGSPTPYVFNKIKVLPVYHTNYPMKMGYITSMGYNNKKDLYIQEILKA